MHKCAVNCQKEKLCATLLKIAQVINLEAKNAEKDEEESEPDWTKKIRFEILVGKARSQIGYDS